MNELSLKSISREKITQWKKADDVFLNKKTEIENFFKRMDGEFKVKIT